MGYHPHLWSTTNPAPASTNLVASIFLLRSSKKVFAVSTDLSADLRIYSKKGQQPLSVRNQETSVSAENWNNDTIFMSLEHVWTSISTARFPANLPSEFHCCREITRSRCSWTNMEALRLSRTWSHELTSCWKVYLQLPSKNQWLVYWQMSAYTEALLRNFNFLILSESPRNCANITLVKRGYPWGSPNAVWL